MTAHGNTSDVLMPQLGETVAEGRISTWFLSEGDKVAAGDDLFEIETDKVTMEVQAIDGGILKEIRVPAGESVPVGTVVAVIETGGAGAGAAPQGNGAADAGGPAAPSEPGPSHSRSPASPLSPFEPLSPFDEVRTPAPVAVSARAPLGLKVTPLARRLIADRALDIEAIAKAVQARGGWRIAAADARAAPQSASAPTPERAPVPPRAAALGVSGQQVEPLNRIRLQTARRLAENWRAIPHVFQGVEADFGRIDAARRAGREDFAARHGVSLTFLPFVARAVCIALADFPRINAHFHEDRLVLHEAVNLGIAVDLGHEGLVVPVVRDAGGMTLPRLAVTIAAQVGKARAGKLTLDDMTGATYSITNNGAFGTQFTTPIIDAPQVAILSLDAVLKKPVVAQTDLGEVVVPRPVAMLGQSFDHRAFDGAYAAAFLSRVREIVESRDWGAELE